MTDATPAISPAAANQTDAGTQSRFMPILRWSLPLCGLFVLGPAIAWFASPISIEGDEQVTTLLNTSPTRGLATVVVGLLAAAGLGRLTLGLTDGAAAVRAAGFAIMWIALSFGSMDEVYRLNGPGAAPLLSLEALLLIGGTILLLTLAFRSAVQAAARLDPNAKPMPAPPSPAIARAASVGVGALVIMLVATLIGITPARTQGFGAAVLGCLLGATAAGLTHLAMTKDEARSLGPWWIPAAAAILAGVLAPLIGLIYPGANSMAELGRLNELPGFLRMQPLDLAAGALIGAERGVAWATSAAKPQEPAGRRRHR